MPSEQVRSLINQSGCRLGSQGLRTRGQHSWAPIPSSEDYTSPLSCQSCPSPQRFYLPASASSGTETPHWPCQSPHQASTPELGGSLSGLCCQSVEGGTTVWTWWEGGRSLDWTGGKLESTSHSVCIGASPLASLGLNFPLCKIKGAVTNPYSSNPDWGEKGNTCK